MDESFGRDRGAVVSAYARAARRLDPGALAGPALRVKSLALRDVFAEIAAGRPLVYRDLRETLDAVGAPLPEMVRTRRRRRWTAALARVMAGSASEEGDGHRALMLYDAVVGEGGPGELDAEHQTIYLQLLFLAGAFDRCATLLPSLERLPETIAHYVRCDLANPYARSVQDRGRWLHLLGQPFADAGLEPVQVPAGDGAPFDRLVCELTENSGSGALVSIIMSVYRPDDSFITSVRSIVHQSWHELELVVVDDASGPGYDRWFERCLELDPRIRLIRHDVNGGTYVARNAGLDAAAGEFITFQDSDDWSHPRRIERQVAPFLSDSAVVATRSLAVRARPDLVHQWLGYPAQRVNASSLMFRRVPVMDRIGYFDSTRKGADAEYAFRLQAAFEHDVVDIGVPLAYTRLQAGSLSRSDFSLGWAAPARIAHQAAYRHWHRGISVGSSYRVPRSPVDRPFPAPATMLDGVPGAPAPRRHFDVVLVDDWQPRRGPFDSACDEVAALTEAGLTVGVVHIEAPGAMTTPRRHPATQIQQLVNDGVVDRVLLDESVTTSLLIVRDPIVMQFPPTEPPRLRASRLVIVASRGPQEYPGLASAYNAATVVQAAHDMFGIEPEWAVADETLRAATEAVHVLPSPVDLRRWSAKTRTDVSNPPVVGTYDSDVSGSELVRAVLTGGSFAARASRGFRRVIPRLVGAATRNTVSYEVRDGRSWQEYLPRLDILTCYPTRGERVAPVEVIVRALAAGVVVIAPRRFRHVFGDSVVYSRRIGAIRAICSYRNHGQYYAQVERGRSYVREMRPPEQYASKIKGLIAE